MNKHMAVAVGIYLTIWAVMAAGIIYGFVLAGYPWWLGLVATYFLFFFGGSSLAYMLRARQNRLEGREPPPYLTYLFFPQGVPKFKDIEAPKFIQVIVGIVAALGGVFFVGCGAALAFSAEYSRMPHPIVAVIICFVLVGIGVALTYVGWRLIAPEKRPPNDAA